MDSGFVRICMHMTESWWPLHPAITSMYELASRSWDPCLDVGLFSLLPAPVPPPLLPAVEPSSDKSPLHATLKTWLSRHTSARAT
jgi:hypothetical protein